MLEGATRVEVDRRPALPIALASARRYGQLAAALPHADLCSSNKMASLDSLDEFVSFRNGQPHGFQHRSHRFMSKTDGYNQNSAGYTLRRVI
jgi:hypothetical protein